MYNIYDQCFLSPTVRHAPDSLCDFSGIHNYFDNENRQFKQYSYRENNHRNYRGINIWNNGLYSFYSYGCSYH